MSSDQLFCIGSNGKWIDNVDESELSQRCVIVQRDEKGFGLRVSGQSPVFVESVKQEGAAWKAGVRPGDRIIKVNGTLVTNQTHQDVVKLIQDCGSYVGLTLLGLRYDPSSISSASSNHESKLSSTPLSDTYNYLHNPQLIHSNNMNNSSLQQHQQQQLESNSKITAPLPANDSTLLEFELTKEKTIKMMIEKEIEFLRKVPNKDKEGTDSTLNRIRKLEEQLNTVRLHIDKIKDIPQQTSSSNRQSSSGKRSSKYNQRRHLSAENLNYYLKGRKGSAEKKEDKDSGSDKASGDSATKKSHSFGQYDHKIISMEDEEEDEEKEMQNKQKLLSSPSSSTSSIDSLVTKDTILRFLNFLVNQRHSLSSTLFLLLLRFYRESVRTAPPMLAKKWVFELCSTFLYPDSPLNFGSGAAEVEELNRIDSYLSSDEGDAPVTLFNLFNHFEQKAKQLSRHLMELYQTQQAIGLGLELNKINANSLQQLISTPLSEQLEFSNVPLLEAVEAILAANTFTTTPPQSVSTMFAQIVCLATVIKRLFPQQLTKDVKKTPVFLDTKVPPLSSSSFLSSSSSLSSSHHHHHHHHSSLSADITLLSSGGAGGVGSSSATGGLNVITHQGHHFCDHFSVSIVYCSGCGHSLWGFFGKQCSQCQLNAHPWCLKATAEESQCVLSSVTSNIRKQRSANKWRSSGGRIVDNIWKRITSDTPNINLTDSNISSNFSAIPQYSPHSSSSDSDNENDDEDTFSSSTTTTNVTTTTASSNRYKHLSSQFNMLSGEQQQEQQQQASEQIAGDKDADDEYDVIVSHPEPKMAPPSPPAPTPPPPLPPRNNSDERKRSDIILELFTTERTHLRNLRLLHHLFYLPMKNEELMSSEHLSAVFSNHESLYHIHDQINHIFRKLKKARRKDIGKELLQIFSGPLGNRLEIEASRFCSQQANGGQATLRQRIKKDSNLARFLAEAETAKNTNRLGLKDLLASCFQRVTKYPLLLESLVKVTGSDVEEKSLLESALRRSKEILCQVNESVKKAESVQRLLQIEKALLTPPPEPLRGKQLVLEGDLIWRITKQKQIEVRAVLTDDLLLLLTREETSRASSEKYHLKPQTHPISRNLHAPVLHVRHLLTRDIATDARAFFLVSTKENALYEFAASSASEKRTWTMKIEELVRAGCQVKLKDLTIPTGNTTSSSQPSTPQININNPLIQLNINNTTNINISSTNNNLTSNGSNTNGQFDNLTENSAVSTIEKKDEEEEEEEEQVVQEVQPETRGRIEGTISYVTSDDEDVEGEFFSDPSSVLNVLETQKSEEAPLIVKSDEQRLKEIDQQIQQLLMNKQTLVFRLLGVESSSEWKLIEEVAKHEKTSESNRLSIISICQELVRELIASDLSLDDDDADYVEEEEEEEEVDVGKAAEDNEEEELDEKSGNKSKSKSGRRKRRRRDKELMEELHSLLCDVLSSRRRAEEGIEGGGGRSVFEDYCVFNK